MHVCVVGKQRFDNLRMALRGSPHQGRLPSRGASVDVGAVAQQQLDDVAATRPCGNHERRLAPQQRAIRIGAG